MSPNRRLPLIEIGFHAFAKGAEEEFGAVRDVRPADREIIVNVEDMGDVPVPLDAIDAVVEQKVIIDTSKLDDRVRDGIARAHRDEDYP
jgi:hypothetical protein